MIARLAFATATDETPDLLLIDEVLSVGDEDFREKSAKRTQELMNGGCAVLLVSHDLDAVEKLSKRTIYLENGKIQAFGPPAQVIEKYLSDVRH